MREGEAVACALHPLELAAKNDVHFRSGRVEESRWRATLG
jgi:hypothetical protein